MRIASTRTKLLIPALLFFCAAAEAQNLVYSLSYLETRASFHARYPYGALGASTAEKLAMLRQSRKTEIYSVSPIDGKPSLLFSDEGVNLEIHPGGSVGGGQNAYVTGILREWRSTPTPGAYAEPPAVYELSLDGSRKFRRLLQVQPNQSPAFLNSQGTQAFVETFVDGNYVIDVYQVPAWNLLKSWPLTNLTRARCPDCLPMSFGWMSDGVRLFFNLDLGDDDSIDEANHNVPGIYLTSADGIDLGSISAETGHIELAGYIHPGFVSRTFIGQLPDGSYVFQDYAAKQGHSPADTEPFLVIANANSKLQKQFPLKPRSGSWSIAPSGEYLAFIEEHRLPNYKSERRLWVKDLRSGDDKQLFVAPPPNLPDSIEPNITLTLLGWLK